MLLATVAPFSVQQHLEHSLAPHYAALRALPDRRALLQSVLYPTIRDELDRVLGGLEVAQHRSARARSRHGLRVLAWNIQRGAQLDRLRGALANDPSLAADVILLSEVDLGMGRSGNRHVARELAEALGMSYVFGVSYLVLGDDVGENPDGVANAQALAGCAVLSRLPITAAANVDLPELRDKFRGREKRLGKKRALAIEVMTAEGPLPIGGCHLDSNASPRQRAEQLAALIDRLPPGPALIGGDLNTSTYDASSTAALARDLVHKLVATGFSATIAGYMTPGKVYERPLFELLAERGFTVDAFNNRAVGTFFYDLRNRTTIEKVRNRVGAPLTWLVQRLLRPWNGVVPARLDWFAGRDLDVRRAFVAEAARGPDEPPLSDHSAVGVELA